MVFDKAHEHPIWAKEIYDFSDHIPETEEYGVVSYVYRARQPFIPEKILANLNGNMRDVIRAKGHFWIAICPEWVAEFLLSGSLSSVKRMCTWWALVLKESWPNHGGVSEYAKAHWQDP